MSVKKLKTNQAVGIGFAAAVLFNVIGFGLAQGCPMKPNNPNVDSSHFQPPGVVFSIVWPILYTLLGVVLAWLIYAAVNKKAPRGWTTAALTLFSVQMALNFAWLPTFSCAKQPKAALYIMIVLVMTQVANMVVVSQVSMTSTAIMSPYTAWLFFALMLNTNSIKVQEQVQS
jgi:tryptophan-rich sensory protein